MKSVDYIVNAKHYSEREGAGGSVKARILKMREKIHKTKGVTIQVLGIDKPSGEPVRARIWQGQWIADCECGGAEFVASDEPIFYCFSCANRANSHRVRPVEFSEDIDAIEAAILARPVNDVRGLDDFSRAGLAQAILYVEKENESGGVDLQPLVRSWNPDEKIEDLHEQNQVIKKWKNKMPFDFAESASATLRTEELDNGI